MGDNAYGKYDTNSQVDFKTSMLKSSLCDYSDSCILLTLTTTITRQRADNNEKTSRWKRKKSKIWKLCAIYWLHKWNR